MRRGKNLIGLGIAVVLGLSLILVPAVSRVSPVQAAVTWTKSGEVTLENEPYVVDAWVIKESSSSYKMWYTHGKKDLSISEIIDDVTALDLDALIDDIVNLDLELFLDDLDLLTADVSAIADLFDGIRTVIGYATSTNGTTWTVQNSEVIAGSSSALWESVSAPSVIKNSDTDYEIWYTRAETDLIQTDLEDILDDIATGSQAERKAAVLSFLNSIGTVIDYATWDGVSANWTVADFQVLPVGSDVGVWGSVANPSVVKNSDTDYEMWYTRATTDVTQTDIDTILADIGNFGIGDLLDILDGTAAVIGYATSTNGVDWTVQDNQVLPLSGNIGVWSSAANPSVVKTGSSYEMWYTNVRTNLIEANLHALVSQIGGLDIPALWDTLTTDGIVDFIVDLVALDIDTIKSILSSTSAVIGYATSSDGISWTVQNSQHLVGSSNSPWSSVAAPSVVRDGNRYEMWYTEGIADLTWQNIIDLVFGDNVAIGYAYYTPSEPSEPSPTPPPAIETELFGIEGSFPIDDDGVIQETIEATSDAGDFTITIPEDTIALDEDGDPLPTLTVELDLDPPDPPAEAHIIGIPYKLGPSGATFSPPMILEFTVDPTSLPPGVAVEDLVLAYYDEVAGEWVELTTTYDPATNTFRAEVEHFTTFAIIGAITPSEEEVAVPEEEVAVPEEEVVVPEEEVAVPEEEVAVPEEEVAPPVVPPVVLKPPIAWWVWLIIGLVSAAVVGFAVRMVVSRRRD